MQALADKRETQLVKYGFTPTVKHHPIPYPTYQAVKRPNLKEEITQNVENIPSTASLCAHPARSSSILGDALIAKYTPAKNKAVNAKSGLDNAHGDKTYTITSTLEQGDKDGSNSMPDLKDCFAKYAKRSSKELKTNSGPQLAKRLEHYSVLPSELVLKNDPTPLELPEPAEIKPPLKCIVSLLSKYDSGQDSSKPEGSNKAKNTTPILASQALLDTNKLQKFDEMDILEKDKFSEVLAPQNIRSSLTFQDEDLEHTVCLPPSSLPPVKFKTNFHTPEQTQNKDMFELKTPIFGKNTTDSPTLGSFSTDLFKKSESKIPEHAKDPPVEHKTIKEVINDENTDTNVAKPAISLSSLLSKYGQKYT